jgi:hypothetical protein
MRLGVHPRPDGRDPPDHLVAGHDRLAVWREVAGHDLQVRPADRARADVEQDLPGAGGGIRAHHPGQPPGGRRGVRGHQFHGDHRDAPTSAIIVPMEWIRRNMTTIGLIVVLAMLLPFLLVLVGVVAF